MAVSINQLTINTKVNKQGGESGGGAPVTSKGMSRAEKEVLIRECMARVEHMIERKLRP